LFWCCHSLGICFSFGGRDTLRTEGAHTLVLVMML
jgi:hypothetical protein